MNRPLCIVALCAAAAAAQEIRSVSGRVLDFDGRPAAGVVVNGVDASDAYLADATTDAAGRFRLPATAGVAAVKAWIEAAELSVPVGGSAAAVEIRAADTPHFAVGVAVVGRDGRPLADAVVRASNDAGHVLGATVTDGAGRARLRSNRPLGKLVVLPETWAIDVPGPFVANAEAVADLRREPWVDLTGFVRAPDGSPLAGVRVEIRGTTGRSVASTVTDAEGRYAASSPRAVASVDVDLGGDTAAQAGPFAASGACDVDLRALGFRTTAGRVVDSAGRPRRGVRVDVGEGWIGLRPAPVATTDADGRFRFHRRYEIAALTFEAGDELKTVRSPAFGTGASVDVVF